MSWRKELEQKIKEDKLDMKGFRLVSYSPTLQNNHVTDKLEICSIWFSFEKIKEEEE